MDGHPVAVKVLDYGPEALPSIVKEISALSRTSHPHVVRFFGYRFFRQDQLGLVLELCECDLEKCLQKGDAKADQLIQYLEHVALGLRYLHQLNLIHRDIKPKNILIVGATAKIGGLGLVREIVDSTMTKGIGTRYFRAPETLWHSAYYTDKADCFSFGMLILAVFARNPRPTPSTRRRDPTRPNIVTVEFLNDPCSFQLPELLMGNSVWLQLAKKCLSQEPDDRPSMADAVAIIEKATH
eukprot:TRINITY_DN553_c0_g1_i3.p1 TRINITY_DN553_c0_g1~~TRINITY_DN553_c0_g1_i3.p1  ORF type:complete len:240 (+),score=41.21 TRINITY_DN553_c0_g1_i3:1189-1908(+)